MNHRQQILILYLTAALLLVNTTIAAAEACNATGISDCMISVDDEEFLMESETSRRILQGVRRPVIGYAPLRAGNPACPGGRCGMKRNRLYVAGKNTCQYKNLCRGAGGGT